MRILSGFCGAVLLLFALLQLNDPDALYWLLIYGAGAFWCALIAFKPSLLTMHRAVRLLFGLTLIAALANTVHHWPSDVSWWTKDAIVDIETVREGLGMMIVTACLAIAGLGWWVRKPSGTEGQATSAP